MPPLNEGKTPAGDIPAAADKGTPAAAEDLGKFKSGAEAAKAHAELEKKYGQQGTELGTLKTENKTLSEQLAGKAEPAAAATVPGDDPELMLKEFKTSTGLLASKYDAGEISMQEVQDGTSQLTMQMVENKTKAETASILAEAKQFMTDTLQQNENSILLDKFHEKYPDFKTMKDSGDLQKAIDADPMHDELSAFHAIRAENAKEEGLTEAARLAAGSDGTSQILADSGSSMQSTQRTGKGLSDADMKASMLKAVQATPGG